jgi:hypothetical protein
MLTINHKVFLLISVIWFSFYLAILFFFSQIEAINFFFGLGIYFLSYSFFLINFLLLRRLKLSPSIFFFMLLVVNGFKIFFIVIFTYVLMSTYFAPNWLFFLIGLILALKTTFYVFLPKKRTASTLENTQQMNHNT